MLLKKGKQSVSAKLHFVIQLKDCLNWQSSYFAKYSIPTKLQSGNSPQKSECNLLAVRQHIHIL